MSVELVTISEVKYNGRCDVTQFYIGRVCGTCIEGVRRFAIGAVGGAGSGDVDPVPNGVL